MAFNDDQKRRILQANGINRPLGAFNDDDFNGLADRHGGASAFGGAPAPQQQQQPAQPQQQAPPPPPPPPPPPAPAPAPPPQQPAPQPQQVFAGGGGGNGATDFSNGAPPQQQPTQFTSMEDAMAKGGFQAAMDFSRSQQPQRPQLHNMNMNAYGDQSDVNQNPTVGTAAGFAGGQQQSSLYNPDGSVNLAAMIAQGQGGQTQQGFNQQVAQQAPAGKPAWSPTPLAGEPVDPNGNFTSSSDPGMFGTPTVNEQAIQNQAGGGNDGLSNLQRLIMFAQGGDPSLNRGDIQIHGQQVNEGETANQAALRVPAPQRQQLSPVDLIGAGGNVDPVAYANARRGVEGGVDDLRGLSQSLPSVSPMVANVAGVDALGSPATEVGSVPQLRSELGVDDGNKVVDPLATREAFTQQLQPIDVTANSIQTPGILGSLESQLTNQFGNDQFAATSELERADLAESQAANVKQRREDLQRLGILRDGDSADVLGDLDSAQRREQLALRGNQEARRDRAIGQGIQLGSLQGDLATSQGAQALQGQGMLLDREQSQAANTLTARGQDINELLGGRGQDINVRGQDIDRLMTERGQDVTQRGQDINQLLTGRGQDITQRGQDISSDVAGRGQDITARGQDLNRILTGRGQNIDLRGQDINRDIAGRGQDVAARGQDVTQRGQDVTARGQDISQGVSERGQDITQRGQDINQLLTGRNQDITQRGQDMNQALGGSRLSLEEQLANMRDVTDNRRIDAGIDTANSNRDSQSIANIAQLLLQRDPNGQNMLSSLGGGGGLGDIAGAAGLGASIGSVIPGLGTGVGALVGGGLSAGKKLLGKLF